MLREVNPYIIRERLLIAEARRWLNFTESGGNNKGQVIEAFQKAVDGRAHGEPWCCSFVMYCIKQIDSLMDDIFSQSLLSRSELFKSEHVMTMWNKSPMELKSNIPTVGSLVCWNYRGTASGHVGIVCKIRGNTIITIEGNTGPEEKVNREGDGVYLKHRSISGQGRMEVRGFLNPWMPEKVNL